MEAPSAVASLLTHFFSTRKHKNDPKPPKRALSAYVFFVQDWRERIRTENPDLSFGKSPLSPISVELVLIDVL
jgi:hypothetical protein